MPSNFLVIGVNHDSATVEVRERVAFSPESVPEALTGLLSASPLTEAVILSTCNRTEVYGWLAENHDVAEAGNAVVDWLCGFHELTQADLNTCIYRNHGLAALKHLVRVSAGSKRIFEFHRKEDSPDRAGPSERKKKCVC